MKADPAGTTSPSAERVHLSFPSDYDELGPTEQDVVLDQMAAAIQEALGKGR